MTTDFNLFLCRLEAERKRLMEELERLKAGVYRAGGNPLDEEEAATERFELEKRLTSEKRMRGDLAEVEYALAKFEKGTYGFCESCGLFIGTARLEALPQANLCLSCKAQGEKAAKGGPIPWRTTTSRYPRYDELDELAEVEEDLENYIAGGH